MRTKSTLLFAAALASPLHADGVPVAVSPGEPDRAALQRALCPNFSFTGVEGAVAYELALRAIEPEAVGADALEAVIELEEPLWTVRLPAGSRSFTASGERCLETAGVYAWRVRARVAPSPSDSEVGAGRGEKWSAPLLFELPEGPSEEELARVLDLLRRGAAAAENGAASTRGARRSRASIVPSASAGALGGSAAVSGETLAAAGSGVLGIASSATGVVSGVEGTAASPQGYGVLGIALATSGAPAGVRGISSTSDGAGVFGSAEGSGGVGVRGTATNGFGVRGTSTATLGIGNGVLGEASAPGGRGVRGINTAPTGSAIGVDGISDFSPDGIGVRGVATSLTGSTVGVRGSSASPDGSGVLGVATTANANLAAGVRGTATSGSGVVGEAPFQGVLGIASATSGSADGVVGDTSSPGGAGIVGLSSTQSTGTLAGLFFGDVDVNGTLSKSGGSFRIDHPLDPGGKYLQHSFVESPDMKNVYDGVVTLDSNGEAWVELPDWFEALNRDFRYQLTSLGDSHPTWIGRKLEHNRFLVRGGPGAEVSWQVTGIRRDPWAERHRIEVEVEKRGSEFGTYLHPELVGAPAERGVRAERAVRLRRQVERESEE